MSYEHSDFLKSAGTRAASRTQAQRADLSRLVAKAEPAMKYLTYDKHWDSFIQILTAAANETDEALTQARDDFTAPSQAGHPDKLLAIRENAMRLQERKITLEQVMSLPKRLIAAAEGEKLKLKEDERGAASGGKRGR